MVMFAIKKGEEYLQGVKANEYYKFGASAPTMGARHSYSEYNAVWGKKKKLFDYRTVQGYFNIVITEFYWEEAKAEDFKIIVEEY